MRDQNLHTDVTKGEEQATSNGDVHLDNVIEGQSDASSNAEADAAAAVVESEQATYASANNDLKGTKAYNSVDVSGLHTLAMAIIDYRGHRVVAQVGFRYYCTFSLVQTRYGRKSFLLQIQVHEIVLFLDNRVSFLASFKETRRSHCCMDP